MRKVIGFILLSSVGVFMACGGGQTETQTPPTQGSASAASSESAAPSASAAPSGSTAGGTKTWDQMNHAERLDVMKTVVLPKLQADFQGYDAKKYEKFSCTTCHGERIKQGNFTMPNPDLPHLSFTDNFKKHKPEMVKFMMQKVEVDTAAAVGEKPFDMQTKTGFGCKECHVVGP